jgi:hypothetical protein
VGLPGRHGGGLSRVVPAVIRWFGATLIYLSRVVKAERYEPADRLHDFPGAMASNKKRRTKVNPDGEDRRRTRGGHDPSEPGSVPRSAT